MQESVQKKLIRKGNFQNLRDKYFAWRELVKDNKLSTHKLSDQDKEVLKDMRFRGIWGYSEVYKLNTILRKYKDELRQFGIDMDADENTKASQPRKAQQPQSRTIGFHDGRFIVSFPWDKRLVGIIKATFNKQFREWIPERKIWKIDKSQADRLAKIARIHDFNVGDRASDILYHGSTNLEQSYSCERVNLELPLKKRLFDYQTVGVDYGHRTMRSWLADQMGLGKTPQGIATAVAVNNWPILVLCPKSLRENWKREIHEWTNYKAMVATKRNMPKIKSFIEHDMCHFLIMNYEGVKTFFVERIREVRGKGNGVRKFVETNGLELLFKGVIIDESHELKNPKTNRYKCIKKVIRKYDYRQLLTGTPIVNSVDDASAQLDLIGRLEEDFGGWAEFNKVYKKRQSHQWEQSEARNLALLNEKLRSTCMIRREKHQVLHELPDKFRTIINCEITNRKEYDLAYLSLQTYLTRKNVNAEKIERSMNAELLVKFALLKKLSAIGKMETMSEVANMTIQSGEKVIIFCWHYETIDAVKEALKQHNCLEISGRVEDDQELEYNKKLFQESDDYPVIIITYKKGGTGHTLTRASNVFFLEPPWTAKDLDQAEDRAHRIGQKSNVNCSYFMGIDTMDQHIHQIIDKKRHLAKESTDSTEQIQTQTIQQQLAQIVLQDAKK